MEEIMEWGLVEIRKVRYDMIDKMDGDALASYIYWLRALSSVW